MREKVCNMQQCRDGAHSPWAEEYVFEADGWMPRSNQGLPVHKHNQATQEPPRLHPLFSKIAQSFKICCHPLSDITWTPVRHSRVDLVHKAGRARPYNGSSMDQCQWYMASILRPPAKLRSYVSGG